MITIVVGVIIVAFIYFSAWFVRQRMGTMGLYSGAFHHALEKGASRDAAYRAAIVAIRHRPPVSQLTETEIDRVVTAFSQFENQWDPGLLLKHALKTERIEFLRDPYLSRMEEKGRQAKKGL